jgi:hypothetical protein
MENRPDTDDIEPGIRPLVQVLNQTGVVVTFSSCEGHYEPIDPTARDRRHAEVRFLPAPGILADTVEQFMGQLLVGFKEKHGILPIQLIGYKLFTPTDVGQLDTTFVLELRPFLRLDPPAIQRADTNRAVWQVVRLIDRGSTDAQTRTE